MTSDRPLPSQVEMTWPTKRMLRVDDLAFVGLHDDDTLDHLIYLSTLSSDAERFITMKTPQLFAKLVTLLDEFLPQNLVEIGLFEGGSTAFISKVLAPRRIVGIDLRTEPLPALEAYVEGLPPSQAVSLHYGVDQADTARLLDIVDGELGVDLIDMVVDDASHALNQTRASFEALWPRIRPGGCYVIEDWTWESVDFDQIALNPPEGAPIRPFVLDLVTCSGMHRSTVREVRTDINFATVVRSDMPVPEGWTARSEHQFPGAAQDTSDTTP